MDAIIKTYYELLSQKKELTEKQYLNKKRLLHVQIIYNAGNLLKALYTKSDCSTLANNLSIIVFLMNVFLLVWKIGKQNLLIIMKKD